MARALTSWGNFRRTLGDLPQAADHLCQAIRLSSEAKASLVTVGALIGLAQVYVAQDRSDVALEIARFVMDHPAASAEVVARAQQLYEDLAGRLTPDQVAAAERRVCDVTLDELARAHL